MTSSLNASTPTAHGPVRRFFAGLGRMLANPFRGRSTALALRPVDDVPATRPADDDGEDDIPPEVRERARRMLADARAQMPTLLEDDQMTLPPPVEHLPTEAAELRRALRAYTDRVDRVLTEGEDERRSLHAEMSRLTDEVQALRRELSLLRHVIPTLTAAITHVAAGLPVDGRTNESAAIAASEEPAVLGSPVGVSEELPSPDSKATVGAHIAEDAGDTAVALATALAANADGGHGSSSEEEPISLPRITEAVQALFTAVAAQRPPSLAPVASVTAAPEPAVEERAPIPATTTPITKVAPEPTAPRPAAHGLDQRVFPAGTIGLTVAIEPVDNFTQLANIQESLEGHPLIESVELLGYETARARLHLTFHLPVRWPALRSALEQATGAESERDTVTLSRGTLSVRLRDAG